MMDIQKRSKELLPLECIPAPHLVYVPALIQLKLVSLVLDVIEFPSKGQNYSSFCRVSLSGSCETPTPENIPDGEGEKRIEEGKCNFPSIHYY